MPPFADGRYGTASAGGRGAEFRSVCRRLERLRTGGAGSGLDQVVRQEQQSGILWNATRLRQLIAEDACEALPKIKVAGFADIKVLPGDELIDALETCYDRDGLDETIVICRSNKRANIYNNGIRSRILWREDELNTGDFADGGEK